MSSKRVLDTTFPLWNGLQEERVCFQCDLKTIDRIQIK